MFALFLFLNDFFLLKINHWGLLVFSLFICLRHFILVFYLLIPSFLFLLFFPHFYLNLFLLHALLRPSTKIALGVTGMVIIYQHAPLPTRRKYCHWRLVVFSLLLRTHVVLGFYFYLFIDFIDFLLICISVFFASSTTLPSYKNCIRSY